jgi:hypothetical protein
MRYRGRVAVSKVDSKGKKIKNLKNWISKNPNSLYFDSYPEWEVWKYIKDSKINHTYQPKLVLFNGINTKEFKKPRQTKKAKAEGRIHREIKDVKQESISYTPDFYLPDFDVYIEVKGYADEVFKLRWKLFKLKGYDGFTVYSLAEFKRLYKQLSEE